MPKKSFTTRLDGAVLTLAQKVAEMDRRSVTSVIELAVIEYAERKGIVVGDGAAGSPGAV